MRGKSRIEAFNKAVAAADVRRKTAISEAYRSFNIKHSETKRLHRSIYMGAYAAWRAIKSRPDAEGYEVAREAFIKASEVVDHSEHARNWTTPSVLLITLTKRSLLILGADAGASRPNRWAVSFIYENRAVSRPAHLALSRSARSATDHCSSRSRRVYRPAT